MSHAIEFTEQGLPMMAYAGNVPWHGLGVHVEDDVTIEEFIIAARLDWTVKKSNMHVNFGGKSIRVEDKQALVRTSDGKILDVVSRNQWNPVQNLEAFEFFRPFLDANQMQLHTAGSLRDGKVVWCLAKVDSDFELFNGDKVESYLLFTNYHTYGKSTDIRFTPVRVVCNNTISFALSREVEHRIAISHKQAFDASEAQLLLGAVNEQMVTYKELVAFLGSRRFDDATMKQYFARVFPHTGKSSNILDFSKWATTEKEGIALDSKGHLILSKNADLAFNIVEIQPGNEFAKGSAWQAVNAVTFLTDHQLGRVKQGDSDERANESRLTASWYGAGKSAKIEALHTAREMAEKAPLLAVA